MDREETVLELGRVSVETKGAIGPGTDVALSQQESGLSDD